MAGERCLLFRAGVVSCALIVCGIAMGDDHDVIRNGGFENGLASWRYTGGVVEGGAHSGTSCVTSEVTEPRRSRVFVVVSRQPLIDSRFSTVICAPVYSRRDGLATQVDVGRSAGLKHDSSIHCDELVSLPKSRLTGFVGSLSAEGDRALDHALGVALGLS